MADKAYTVGDLRRLLKDESDDTPLAVAAAPDVTGWVQYVLMIKHTDDNSVILALSEDAASDEERTLLFFDEEGHPTRPV